MADGRQRAEWERTCYLMAWVGRFSGGPFRPDELLRARFGDPDPAARREPTEAESAMGWAMLEAAFQYKARHGG